MKDLRYTKEFEEIDASTRDIQDVALKILVEFDKYCKKNNLKYYLTYGTLIGAIRHQGFIPWDDDIDIIMPREEYDKFVKIVRAGNDIDGLKLQFVDQKNSLVPFIKLTSDEIFIREKIKKDLCPMWIDIFPLEKYPADFQKRKKYTKKLSLLLSLHFLSIKDKERAQFSSVFKQLRYYAVAPFIKLFGTHRFNKLINKFSQKYNKLTDNYVLGSLVWDPYPERIGTEEDYFGKGETRTMLFEGNYYPVPFNTEDILERIYGDYMTMPDEKDRQFHAVAVYKKIKE